MGAMAHACAGALVAGTCFTYHPQAKTWIEAESFCMQSGGHLVSIHSEAENRLVHDLCDQACWIGYNDIRHEGMWKWSDGSAPDFYRFPHDDAPWNPGEPNGRSREITDAAYMYNSTIASPSWAINAGMWDDTALTIPMPFVCRRAIGSAMGSRPLVDCPPPGSGATPSADCPPPPAPAFGSFVAGAFTALGLLALFRVWQHMKHVGARATNVVDPDRDMEDARERLDTAVE